MNRNSNGYIVTYAGVMVAVVALALAFASLSLQGRQNANVENEMKGAILRSVGVGEGKAMLEPDEVNSLYARYIVDAFAVDAGGEKVAGADAFALLKDLKAEYEKPAEERVLPVFVSRDDKGKTRYILPLWGSGLWGAIWGYVALDSDWDTIYGAVFDHTGETPGLGAEIATPAFGGQFRGKTIFRDGRFASVGVAKSGKGDGTTVDAISGGTITSRGVEKMLRDNLTGYLPYIEKVRTAEDGGDEVNASEKARAAEGDGEIPAGPAAENGADVSEKTREGETSAGGAIGVIGNADGPTAIFVSMNEKNTASDGQ